MLCLVILLSAFSVCAFAESVEVYAEPISAKSGDEVLVAVNIKDNTGIMGFKLHFAYLDECVKINSVSRAVLTSKGNFTTNLGSFSDGFDVVWNNTENISGDGSIILISLCLLTDDPFEIYISFSEPDTFNESWENIYIDCSPVKVNEKIEEETVSELSETEIVSKSEEIFDENGSETAAVTVKDVEITSDEIELIVDSEINKEGYVYKELSDEQKEKLRGNANKIIKNLFGVSNYFKSSADLDKKYIQSAQESFARDVGNLGNPGAAAAISSALTKANAKKITQSNIRDVIELLEEEGLDEKYGDNFDDEQLANFAAYSLDAVSEDDAVKTSEKIKPFIFILIVILLSAFLIFMLIEKNKSKKLQK